MFSSVGWGEDDALGDQKLKDYFVELPEYSKILEGKIRYVIGRKGTGKTAIAEKIRLDAEDRFDWFTGDLTLKNFPVALFRNLADRSEKGKARYISAWTFLICVRLASLVFLENSCNNTREVDDIRKFLNNNFITTTFSFPEIIKTIIGKKSKVSLEGLSTEGSRSIELQGHIHF